MIAFRHYQGPLEIVAVPGEPEGSHVLLVAAFERLGAGPVEPLAQQVMAELMAKGWAHTNFLDSSDLVLAAWSVALERWVAAIIWRPVEENGVAWVVLGAVHPDYRRRGIYEGLWTRFLAMLAVEHADLSRVESGYHIENEASAAMHRKLGRQVTGVLTSFDLDAYRQEIFAGAAGLKPPPGCIFLSETSDA